MRNKLLITLLMLSSLSAAVAYADFDLDVDDDGKTTALTDGLLIIRHLFGFSGDSLTAGPVSEEALEPRTQSRAFVERMIKLTTER